MKSQIQRALRRPFSHHFPLARRAAQLIPAHPRFPSAQHVGVRATRSSLGQGSRLQSTVPRYSVLNLNSGGSRQVTGHTRHNPREFDISPHNLHLKSGISVSVILVTVVAISTVLVLSTFIPTNHTPDSTEEPVVLLPKATMAPQLLEGRPGNLTPEQEEKLRKLWSAVFQLTGVTEGSGAAPLEAAAPEESAPASEPEKKKRFGLFRKGKESKSGSSSPAPEPAAKDGGDDDKYGQTKQFYETLANHSPETIRSTIWAMVKHDHPDALLLRFLRARKWDVDKALVMLVSTMNWRHSEMRVDDDIMKNGEAGNKLNEESGEGEDKKLGADFLAQIRMGKSFLHGIDKNGRPICVVRVRLHRQGEQCEESLEKYTVYIIETARMVLSPPVDTATIIFDMTGFSMANMDYTPVKFMIKCFEANYPESLGAVLVHNSPWVFQGIWKIIRGWLDPVVAGKVHFTNNKNDLEKFIEPSRILKELEGDEDWEYKYEEPIPGENDKMKDTATRDKLLASREDVVKKFEATTLEWIKKHDGTDGSSLKSKREQLATQLREGYWILDPYVRARSLYDRTGVIKPGGSVDFYSTKTQAKETSADDVD
ncbi:unnamed protein product [Clonostachys rhizophaga]|uniref:CRAL-TRIO domain-containing protein n=1 Tax=Clonostachys rhizophaga TaxID=160324 RepID=A0A9N9YBU7_9HYPO|nr:unnamed protein product [Clonostachys rhizophaga]